MCETEKDTEGEIPVHKKVDLDTILIKEIGQFGRYQIQALALVAVGVILSASCAEFVFTSARITTRCLVPECENSSTQEFIPSWIFNAIPAKGNSFDNCRRYGNTTIPVESWNGTCPSALFDGNSVQDCEEQVYEHTETVVYDFNLGCNEWKRSFIGFVRTLGTFVALPMTGHISDRWGRRTALALNCFNTAWLGLTRYWVNTYMGFIFLELLETIFGGGVFSTAYILVCELVGPEYRVIAGGILTSSFALGNVLVGFIAWAVPNWRSLTLALFIPQLITIGYFWVISESVRWYMSKGDFAKSEVLLRDAARINNKPLSDKSLQLLRLTVEEEKKRKAMEDEEEKHKPWLVVLVFRHTQILIRCFVLPVCWITMTLVYYGLTINAVNLSGNKYVNYMIVSAVGIPGFWISVFLMSKIGRKLVLMGSFWICAACQFAYIFLPPDMYELTLFLYLVGECAIAAVVAALYMYTTELYPTKYRHNLVGYSSMIGRIGSLAAPLTPAIGAATFEKMPFLLFGSFALASGVLLFFTPETMGTKLPDTLEEAENLGMNNKQ